MHLARPAGDLLGRYLVRRRRHLPGPMIARREPGTRASSRSRCSVRSRSSSRHPDRLPPRRPRRARRTASNWFGLQGFEYLDLARVWQILLRRPRRLGVHALARAAARLAREHRGNMPWLFFLAACAIPAFYAVGLLARTGENFTTTEFWRFWVVHLWVEDFLELFTTVMVADMFVLLGVVRSGSRCGRLPRRRPLLGRRRDRDDAPPLILRRAGGAHGARRLLLGRRGPTAHVPDGGGTVVPSPRLDSGVAYEHRSPTAGR